MFHFSANSSADCVRWRQTADHILVVPPGSRLEHVNQILVLTSKVVQNLATVRQRLQVVNNVGSTLTWSWLETGRRNPSASPCRWAWVQEPRWPRLIFQFRSHLQRQDLINNMIILYSQCRWETKLGDARWADCASPVPGTIWKPGGVDPMPRRSEESLIRARRGLRISDRDQCFNRKQTNAETDYRGLAICQRITCTSPSFCNVLSCCCLQPAFKKTALLPPDRYKCGNT